MVYQVENKNDFVWVRVYETPKDLKFSPYLRHLWEKRLSEFLPDFERVEVAETDTSYKVYIGFSFEKAEEFTVKSFEDARQKVESVSIEFVKSYEELLRFLKDNGGVK